MFIYPQINPIAFSLGPIQVHWYGLMYVIGFVCAWLICQSRASKPGSGWTKDDITDIITWVMLGAIIGARLGYVLFYDLANYISSPIEIFYVWKGGMSFHGGFIGVTLVLYLWSKSHNRNFLDVVDMIAPGVAPGLFFGRIGNFINGELWGKVTDSPLGMVFPHAGDLPRHPVQLYEACLEGLVLFAIVWVFSSKERAEGANTGMLVLCYAVFRIFCEFFREPDVHIGYLLGDWFTMGMLLSLPLLALGIFLLARSIVLEAKPRREKIILDDGSVVWVKKNS